MTTSITSTDIARVAERAAPGRVSYDLTRSKTITIKSTDGESELHVGLADDPVDGGECVLAVKRSIVELFGAPPAWQTSDSVDVKTLYNLQIMIADLG